MSVLHKDQDFILFTKYQWQYESLSTWAASLRSSKKPYIVYNDPTIKNRGVINQIALPLDQFESIDKAVPPTWFKNFQKARKTKNNTVMKGLPDEEISGLGFMPKDTSNTRELDEVLEEFDLDIEDFRWTTHSNGYVELRRKV